MKIALVHDYLLEAGGAERGLRVLCDMYPKAPIYTALAKNGTAKAMFEKQTIIESKWSAFLKIGRLYSYFRFLLPWIWGSIDLTDYDLVITSSSGYIARGFRVRSEARVICYCHTPPRWLYGYDTPTGASAKWWGKAFMWIVGPPLRYFDFKSAQRVDVWIANSEEVAGRIDKFYRKKAVAVYPPIEIDPSTTLGMTKREDYYLMISRIVGGKGIGEAIEGAKAAGINLRIAGEIIQPLDHYTIRPLKNVEYLGRVDDYELANLYANAKGFVALSRDEDFGMTVVEAMAQGTPVLAFNGGGYRETVIDPDNQKNQRIGGSESQRVRTGVLIDGTDTVSVKRGIERMEKTKWDREEIKKWASRFGRERFEKEIREIIRPLKH